MVGCTRRGSEPAAKLSSVSMFLADVLVPGGWMSCSEKDQIVVDSWSHFAATQANVSSQCPSGHGLRLSCLLDNSGI